MRGIRSRRLDLQAVAVLVVASLVAAVATAPQEQVRVVAVPPPAPASSATSPATILATAQMLSQVRVVMAVAAAEEEEAAAAAEEEAASVAVVVVVATAASNADSKAISLATVPTQRLSAVEAVAAALLALGTIEAWALFHLAAEAVAPMVAAAAPTEAEEQAAVVAVAQRAGPVTSAISLGTFPATAQMLALVLVLLVAAVAAAAAAAMPVEPRAAVQAVEAAATAASSAGSRGTSHATARMQAPAALAAVSEAALEVEAEVVAQSRQPQLLPVLSARPAVLALVLAPVQVRQSAALSVQAAAATAMITIRLEAAVEGEQELVAAQQYGDAETAGSPGT